jgi:hypothetical protein
MNGWESEFDSWQKHALLSELKSVGFSQLSKGTEALSSRVKAAGA